MRQDYEMTQTDLDRILDACKPVPYMVIGGIPPRSQQQNANTAWAALGQKMGFQPMTVLPGRDVFHFTAEPSEQHVVMATAGYPCDADGRDP